MTFEDLFRYHDPVAAELVPIPGGGIALLESWSKVEVGSWFVRYDFDHLSAHPYANGVIDETPSDQIWTGTNSPFIANYPDLYGMAVDLLVENATTIYIACTPWETDYNTNEVSIVDLWIVALDKATGTLTEVSTQRALTVSVYPTANSYAEFLFKPRVAVTASGHGVVLAARLYEDYTTSDGRQIVDMATFQVDSSGNISGLTQLPEFTANDGYDPNFSYNYPILTTQPVELAGGILAFTTTSGVFSYATPSDHSGRSDCSLVWVNPSTGARGKVTLDDEPSFWGAMAIAPVGGGVIVSWAKTWYDGLTGPLGVNTPLGYYEAYRGVRTIAHYSHDGNGGFALVDKIVNFPVEQGGQYAFPDGTSNGINREWYSGGVAGGPAKPTAFLGPYLAIYDEESGRFLWYSWTVSPLTITLVTAKQMLPAELAPRGEYDSSKEFTGSDAFGDGNHAAGFGSAYISGGVFAFPPSP